MNLMKRAPLILEFMIKKIYKKVFSPAVFSTSALIIGSSFSSGILGFFSLFTPGLVVFLIPGDLVGVSKKQFEFFGLYNK